MALSARPSRIPANLSLPINQRLNMYALAASAAGAGVLCLAHPQTTEAKIVYTPANVAVGNRLNLDLNNDGITDFELCDVSSYHYGASCTQQRGRRTLAEKHRPSPFFADLFIYPAMPRNEIWGHSAFRQRPTASALPAGVRIGPKGKFSRGNRLMATWGSADGQTYYGGPWKNAQHRYLGLKFIIKGKVHYGWARLDVHWHPKISATLTGYAYETVPNKSIVTGKKKGPTVQGAVKQSSPPAVTTLHPDPAALGFLAMGSPGLSVWRREDAMRPTP